MLVAGALYAGPAAPHARAADVALLPGAGAIHFVVEVAEPDLVALEDAAGARRLTVPGYLPQNAGGVELPARIVTVAVPPRGTVRLEVAGSGERVWNSVTLDAARSAPLAVGDVAPLESQTAVPPASGALARVVSLGWLRNQRVARIEVTPATYDPNARTLRVVQRIDVRVAVEGATSQGAPAEARDPFESIYEQVLLNYEQGKAWRRAAGRAPGGVTIEAVALDSGSVFVGRDWVKIAVPKSGFYRVEFNELRRLAPFNGEGVVAVDSLRLFAWPEFPLLEEIGFCDTCDYREVAIGIVDDGDRLLNVNSDAIYFYALGPSDWADEYDRSRPDTTFLNNPYDVRSYYYFTFSTAAKPVPGPFRRIALAAGAVSPGGGEITPATFEERRHEELDAEYIPNATPVGSTAFWEKWFWTSLRIGNTFEASFDVPGMDTLQAARLRLRLWGIYSTGGCSPSARTHHFADLAVNATVLERSGWNRVTAGEAPFTVDRPVTGLVSAGNTLRLTVPIIAGCPTRDDRQAVAWFDVFYPRRFEPENDALMFRSPPAPGDYLYRIAPFQKGVAPENAAPPRVFDVTDPYRPIEIQGAEYIAVIGGWQLSFEASQAGERRYRILPQSQFVKSGSADLVTALRPAFADLRARDLSADYLVIYYDDFEAAATELATLRRTDRNLATTIVPVSSIYDQFSGGRTDPGALRNFLRAAFKRWARPPAFVTFLGDASYDFKNFAGYAPSGQPPVLVPSYVNGFDLGNQFTSDDWILDVETEPGDIGSFPDFLGGRIPVNDANEALDFVRNKQAFYERSTPLGEYRNRLMLIADDHEAAERDDALHWAHLAQTSILDSLFTPQHLDRHYVYLHTYPDGAGSTKPLAKEDIRKTINGAGVAAFNYVGHGSPFKLSDESVFLDADVDALTNRERLPVLIAASCDVGKYDNPPIPSLGERILLRQGGGAIGVVSATELARSFANAALNDSFFLALFRRAANGSYDVTVAGALLTAKIKTAGRVIDENNQKYNLLGDAALKINLPEHWVRIALYDSAGTAELESSVIRQGQSVVFRGQVVEGPQAGAAGVPLDGVLSMLIEDSAPIDRSGDCRLSPGCIQSNYYYRAGPLYRGDVGVKAGSFEGRFIVPLEARTGAHGRVRGYVSGAAVTATDGVGSLRVQVSPGSAPASDREGPRISLSFAGGSTLVRPDAQLRIDLFDANGILIAGHTRQNGIIVTIDGNTTSRADITSSFRYAADSYQSGTASFQLPVLAAGSHRVEVSAADNLAIGLTAGEHRTSAAIDFEVADIPPLRITRAYLFPDPIRSKPAGGGQFVIDAPGDSINVLLKVYTVSGRLIRTLVRPAGIGQVQIPWDGLDQEGDALANGVYLFRVHANVRDPDGASSARQKALAEGKFVVVNH